MKQNNSVPGTKPVARKQWVKPVVTVASMAAAQQGSTTASSDSAFSLS